MKLKNILILTVVFLTASLIVIGCTSSLASRQDEGQTAVAANDSVKNDTLVSDGADKFDDKFDGKKIVKTEAEWRKLLTPDEFYVLREQGTERAYTGKYTDNHEHGDYYCAACHLKVFSSDTKFDSGTGWASFYKPADKANITEITDSSLGMTRTEIVCSRCNSHLGHVFDDGPEPTGLRYCINSVALDFQKKK